jgi:hypothetical protein
VPDAPTVQPALIYRDALATLIFLEAAYGLAPEAGCAGRCLHPPIGSTLPKPIKTSK